MDVLVDDMAVDTPGAGARFPVEGECRVREKFQGAIRAGDFGNGVSFGVHMSTEIVSILTELVVRLAPKMLLLLVIVHVIIIVAEKEATRTFEVVGTTVVSDTLFVLFLGSQATRETVTRTAVVVIVIGGGAPVLENGGIVCEATVAAVTVFNHDD